MLSRHFAVTFKLDERKRDERTNLMIITIANQSNQRTLYFFLFIVNIASEESAE